jgi:hypothetical protein
MPIVLDANVLVILVSGDPRKAAAETHVREWMTAGEEIHAAYIALTQQLGGQAVDLRWLVGEKCE